MIYSSPLGIKMNNEKYIKSVSVDECLNLLKGCGEVYLDAPYLLVKKPSRKYHNVFVLRGDGFEVHIRFKLDLCEEGKFILSNLNNVVCQPIFYCNCLMLGVKDFTPAGFIMDPRFDMLGRKFTRTQFKMMKEFVDSSVLNYSNEVKYLIDNLDTIDKDFNEYKEKFINKFNLNSFSFISNCLSSNTSIFTKGFRFGSFIEEYKSIYGDETLDDLLKGFDEYNSLILKVKSTNNEIYCKEVLLKSKEIFENVNSWDSMIENPSGQNPLHGVKDGILVRLVFNDLQAKCLLNNLDYSSCENLKCFDKRFNNRNLVRTLVSIRAGNFNYGSALEKDLIEFLSNEIDGPLIDMDSLIEDSLIKVKNCVIYSDCKLIFVSDSSSMNKEFIFIVPSAKKLIGFVDLLYSSFLQLDSVSECLLSIGKSYEDCVNFHNKFLTNNLQYTFKLHNSNKQLLTKLISK